MDFRLSLIEDRLNGMDAIEKKLDRLLALHSGGGGGGTRVKQKPTTSKKTAAKRKSASVNASKK